MSTALALITDSLRTIGAVPSGETPTASEAQDALTLLNERIEMLNATDTTVFQIMEALYTITQGTGAYTFGEGGAWNAPRPIAIQQINYVVSGMDTPLERADEAVWFAITQRSQVGRPCVWYDDGAFPLRTITLYPAPSVTAFARVFTWAELAGLAALDTPVVFPPVYRHFLRYDLARVLAPEWELPFSPLADEAWRTARAVIQRLHTRKKRIRSDPSVFAVSQGHGYARRNINSFS